MGGRVQKELAQAKYLFPFPSLMLHIRSLLAGSGSLTSEGLRERETQREKEERDTHMAKSGFFV